jgi:hypothetical protein
LGVDGVAGDVVIVIRGTALDRVDREEPARRGL